MSNERLHAARRHARRLAATKKSKRRGKDLDGAIRHLREKARLSEAEKDAVSSGQSIVTERTLRDPTFVVCESSGKRRRERLNEPLPTWLL